MGRWRGIRGAGRARPDLVARIGPDGVAQLLRRGNSVTVARKIPLVSGMTSSAVIALRTRPPSRQSGSPSAKVSDI
jgi:hypothetical protein